MEMRRLFPVQRMHQKSSQQYSECAEPGEQERKRQADLSEQLERLIRIIPDSQMKVFIYNQTGQKFQCRDKDDGTDHLQPEWILPVQDQPLPGTEPQCNSAQYEHAPVGKTPKHHFKRIIDTASQRKNK